MIPGSIHHFKYSNLSELAENGPLASQSQRGIFRLFTFLRHLTSDIIINEKVDCQRNEMTRIPVTSPSRRDMPKSQTWVDPPKNPEPEMKDDTSSRMGGRSMC